MTRPYELLVRFNQSGGVAGVSVRTITTVNGRDYESDPAPLADATDPVFVAFAEQFAAAVVEERDSLRSENADLLAELTVRTGQRDTEASAKNAALDEVQRLQSELDALKNPVDTNGFPILSAVQLRLGVLAAGISPETIDEKIASIQDVMQRVQIQTYWQYATEFHRDNPMIAAMAPMLGLSPEQVNALWIAAGEIQ